MSSMLLSSELIRLTDEPPGVSPPQRFAVEGDRGDALKVGYPDLLLGVVSTAN